MNFDNLNLSLRPGEYVAETMRYGTRIVVAIGRLGTHSNNYEFGRRFLDIRDTNGQGEI